MPKQRTVRIAKLRDQTPDHLFYGTVRDFETNKIVARRVLCEIHIPQSHRAKFEITFYPTPEQIPAFQFVPAISVRGQSRPSRFLFESDEVWHEGAQTGGRDGIEISYPCLGQASTAQVTYLFGNSKSNRIKSGAFWLTECPLINTATIITRSYTGNVRVKQIVKPRFTLNSGIRLMFRKHFHRSEDGESDVSQLVAEFKPKSTVSPKSFKSSVNDFDDMLLLVTFASRRSCLCTGWSYVDTNGNLTRYYRRDHTIPSAERRNLDECLISMRNFMRFLRTTYNNLTRTTHKELLRNAIFALTNEGGSVDNQLLRVFAGLESILMYVLRVNNDVRRLKLYQKFEVFQRHYKIDFTDLWPLLNSSSGKSLAEIRNRSIHGEYLSETSVRALIYVQFNLRWTVERMLLSVLGWPIEKSNVSKSFLPHLTMYRWQKMQSKI